jgi:hypothetical protein
MTWIFVGPPVPMTHEAILPSVHPQTERGGIESKHPLFEAQYPIHGICHTLNSTNKTGVALGATSFPAAIYQQPAAQWG